ncbi:hypothetical protein Tco_0697980, partial [Tanacetum coccineum]
VIEQVAVRSGMDSKVAELNTPDYLPLLYCKNGGVTDWYQRHGYREQGRTSILSPISSLDHITPPTILHRCLIPVDFFPPKEISSRKGPPKRTSTSAAPAMTQDAIRQLVVDSVATALKAQAANIGIYRQ